MVAAVEALRRLGQQDAIAAEVLAKPELRSWPERWPWIVSLLRPVLLLLLLPALPVLACAGRRSGDRQMERLDQPRCLADRRTAAGYATVDARRDLTTPGVPAG